jgi:hypothetical protein
VGRDPTSLERTVAVLVQLPTGSGRLSGEASTVAPLTGPPEAIAAGIHAYAQQRISHVQLVLDPITVCSIEALGRVLELLDRLDGPT